MASTNEEINQLPEGSIRFLQQKKPALQAGVYEVCVTHTVKIDNEEKQVITSKKTFAIRGERFQLDPTNIRSCYPPEKVEGNFCNCLPHIVLKNATLPWERTAGGNVGHTPWLALLLFYEDELSKIQTETVKLKDLKRHEPGWQESGESGNDQYEPGWRESGESGDDQCTILEVPKDLLDTIVPKKADLNWLSHVRQVGNERKEDPADGAKTDYAVIIGNRLPKIGQNVVYLVSLEGYYDDARKHWYEPVDNRVQLVTLKSWSFTTAVSQEEKTHSFANELEKLHRGAFRSRKESSDPTLQGFLANGYTLLRHQMRQGDRSVSLYRGPLVPCRITITPQPPIACSDQVIRFYQDLGLFDVSYAAAWQLGRLLALQNRDFSNMLYQWKRETRQKELIDKAKKDVKKELGNTAFSAHKGLESEEKVDRYAEVVKWVGELRKLSDIPLHYLVPDMEHMLPNDSIRFFYVDINWTDRLTDGAFSIGRATSQDLKHDAQHLDGIKQHSDQAARDARKKQGARPESEKDQTITGILIRSEIIANWPGLEIDAYSGRESSLDKKLPLLRMKRLSDSILICLFEGELQRVDIHQPSEGLHYGVEQTAEGMRLRDPQTGVYGSEYVPVLFRNEEERVLHIDGMAKAVPLKFQIKAEGFTAAHFAVAMIAGTKHVNFLSTTTSK